MIPDDAYYSFDPMFLQGLWIGAGLTAVLATILLAGTVMVLRRQRAPKDGQGE